MPRENSQKRGNKDNVPKTHSDKSSIRKPKLNSFERAKQVYEQIQEQKKKEREQQRVEREERNKAVEEYNTRKKKMQKAIKKKNKKGQPNLGAQMEAVLEKIQHKIKKKDF